MKMRRLLPIAGLAGTFVAAQLVTAAIATPHPNAVSQSKKLLASYEQTNKRLAVCMHGKGLAYDAGLAKSDVVDAFGGVPAGELDAEDRAEIDALKQNAADDPNEATSARMSPSQRDAWAAAVNECSARLQDEDSGGAEGRARIAQLQRAAKESAEVKAALRAYVGCMGRQGFTVEDPFMAPKVIAEAEDAPASAAGHALLDGYDKAWRGCVAPYQQAYDLKLFGSY